MNMGRKANLVAYKLLQNEVICVVDRPVSVAQSSAQFCAGIHDTALHRLSVHLNVNCRLRRS